MKRRSQKKKKKIVKSGRSFSDLQSSIFLPKFEAMNDGQTLESDGQITPSATSPSQPVVSYLKTFTEFHEFTEFTAEDIGTSESGLNSVVLANNDEMVLLSLNELVYGTKRKGQIQPYAGGSPTTPFFAQYWWF